MIFADLVRESTFKFKEGGLGYKYMPLGPLGSSGYFDVTANGLPIHKVVRSALSQNIDYISQVPIFEQSYPVDFNVIQLSAYGMFDEYIDMFRASFQKAIGYDLWYAIFKQRLHFEFYYDELNKKVIFKTYTSI